MTFKGSLSGPNICGMYYLDLLRVFIHLYSFFEPKSSTSPITCSCYAQKHSMSPMVAATPETTLMINGILDFDPEKENGTLKRERETHEC